MRVMVLSWEYPPVIEGGLGRHVRHVCEQLAGEDTEVHVLTRSTDPAAEEPAYEVQAAGVQAAGVQAAGVQAAGVQAAGVQAAGVQAAGVQAAGVHVHRIAAPPVPSQLDEFLRWVARCNRAWAGLGRRLDALHGFDLVHSHDWLVAEAAFRLSRNLGKPWLTTVHATEHGRHQGWVGRHPQSHIHAAERRMVHRADHVIACSTYMAKHITEVFRVPPGKVTAVPNGIDPQELAPAPEVDLGRARERFARAEEPLVFMVGRLVYEKGFHLALEALAQIRGEVPGVRFVIAGAGPAEADLITQARDLGIADAGSFLGWIGDETLHTLYRVADLCVIPSIYEPFGIVALEAMAAGCVCVVADTGGLREIVPADGSAGARFEPGNVEALAIVLGDLLGDADRRRSMACAARAHAELFDWSGVADRTREVYEQLIRERHGLSAGRAG